MVAIDNNSDHPVKVHYIVWSNHLARRRPSVPIVPVYLHGFGRVLPKGSALPVPLRCKAFAGTLMTAPTEDATRFVDELETTMTQLTEGTAFPEWE